MNKLNKKPVLKIQNLVYIVPKILKIKTGFLFNRIMYEIIAYLYYAKKIVTSYGAISYAHTMFFNPNINYHFLMLQYDPYFMIDKHKILQVSQNLDENMETVIDFLENK